MKNKKQHLITYIILTALPLLITAVSLFLLPDRIPAHYGVNGNVDRIGSKFEMLIFPLTSFVMATIMWFSAKFTSKNETSTKNNEKIVIIVGECVLAIFLIMQIYFLYLAFNNAKNIYSNGIDLGKLMNIFLGIFMIVLGNIMPKAKKNSFVGFRMKWTMTNEEVWKKCQHFAGITSIVLGILLLVSAFIFSEFNSIIAFMCLTTVMIIIDSIYAYKISHINSAEN